MTDKTDQLKLLTVPEVAEMLSISNNQVYVLKAIGELPFIKISRSTRFDLADVQRFVADRKQGGNGI
jgi:excisionase family DNA binding protein